ncbi:restriction endonuclease subunit S [Arthrobacter sp. G119Y2]|uniref:restriction endonuclease subunit S n=1 Tax=Arthrobacter sp. G119Y2 TaxID=3134965 RepID=UPI00311A5421
MKGVSPYSEYKDSKIPWVGAIPKEWNVSPLFSVAHESRSKNSEDSETNLLSLSYGRIIRKDINAVGGLLPASFSTYQIVRQDDIVLRLTDLQNDKRSLRSAIVPERGIITSAYLALSPTQVGPRFLSYLLRSYDLQKVFYSMGGGLRQSMQFWDLKWLPIVLPSVTTQESIVHYLDRETAKIDELTAKQERLIELLAEKRQAIITQAVTKGLGHSVPTKPSGIPWVPASPIHWTASRIKWTHPKQESGTSVNGTDVPAGSGHIGVLKTGAVSKGYFLASSSKTVVPEDVDRATCPVRGGTLIVNRANTPDLVGSTGVPETDIPTLFLSDKLWQIEFKEANTRFMYWWTKTDGYRSQIQFRRVGASSSMQNLSYSDFLTVDLAVPPLSEQGEIARYLDGRTKQLDTLALKAQQAISLLRERRSALISAAVTGKIDVREMAA